jgi:hypothetical protein
VPPHPSRPNQQAFHPALFARLGHGAEPKVAVLFFDKQQVALE